ncbi:MAG: hypothetical protein CVU89_14265 [Firmicutes bacterium HGW-Firmicutes-14]|nr:MAG: hypothetical protein CVU89_14265 [Firmicutes bacterium HGW-Firmicutes-14]
MVKRMSVLSVFTAILIVTVIAGFPGITGANTNETGRYDCTICHSTYVSDFNSPNVVDVNRVRCYQCHTHGLHTRDYNSNPLVIVRYIDPDTGKERGAVFLQDPNSVTPVNLHAYHSQPDKRATSCAECHINITCKSCHQTIPHNSHGSTKYSPVSLWMTSGVFGGPGYYTNSCTTSNCHSTFKEPYNPAKVRADADELCINCHGTDKRGHYDQAKLDAAHNSNTTSLKIGGIDNMVSCQGCHAGPLTTEHDNIAEKLNLPEDTECGYCHGIVAQESVKTVVTEIMTATDLASDQSVKASRRACTECHFNVTVLPSQPAEHVVWHKAILSDNLDVSGGPHTDCNTCHANAGLYSTIYNLATIPVSSRNYDCFVCHNEQNAMAPVHTADFEGEITEVTGLHWNCSTCHASGTDSANAVGRILAENREKSYSCSECHSGTDLENAHNGVIDTNCTQSCHKSSLIDEHINNPVTQVNNQDNPLSCKTCHNSGAGIEAKLAVATGNTDCAACHFQAHNMNIVQQVPVDIPLYPGYKWGVPQPALIWAAEDWMPDGYEGAKLLISNRRLDVTGSAVWTYYKQEMQAHGWIPPETDPDPSNNFFVAEFTKDRRKTTVFFYGGENHSSTPISEGGYRIEVLYK